MYNIKTNKFLSLFYFIFNRNLVYCNAFSKVYYPYNPNIHNFGNHGFLGKIHAKLAPIFTRTVNENIYKTDIRQDIINMEDKNKTFLDIGCGTGFSTSSNPGSLGIDTSFPMINEAKRLFPNKNFTYANIDFWNTKNKFDIVTAMFVFHEIPQDSRKNIIKKMKNIAKEKIIILDIHTDYKPNKLMLSGEPYIQDYLKNIQKDLSEFKEKSLVTSRVKMWYLDIENNTNSDYDIEVCKWLANALFTSDISLSLLQALNNNK